MSTMLDLSKPEIERAYRLGIKAGEVVAIKATQAATAKERNRIVRLIRAYAIRAKKSRNQARELFYLQLIDDIESGVNPFEVKND